MEIEEDIKAILSERELPESLKAGEEGKEEISAGQSDSEEIDFEAFRRGRGRPSKSSSIASSIKRPFQKYKNSF